MTNVLNASNEDIVARIQAGEQVNHNMLLLWEQNQGIINKVASKYSSYCELEDLTQEGYFGLRKAVDHYKQEMGVKFITYAVFWIKQEMLRYLANNCSTV